MLAPRIVLVSALLAALRGRVRRRVRVGREPGERRLRPPGGCRSTCREARGDRGPPRAAREARPQRLLSVDRATGRPRVVGRLDGTLTGPSGDTAAEVALQVPAPSTPTVYGLRAADVAALAGRSAAPFRGRPRQRPAHAVPRRRDVDRLRRPRGARRARSPRRARRLAGSRPRRRRHARRGVARRGGEARRARIRRARRAPAARVSAVIFHVGPTARLGWRALVAAGPRQLDDVLVDATSGAIVRRANRVRVRERRERVPRVAGRAARADRRRRVDLAPYLDDARGPDEAHGPERLRLHRRARRRPVRPRRAST